MTVTALSDYRQTAPPARPLPANIDAEQAVIGAVLVNNEAFHAIGSRLEAEHFSEEIHRRIWEVVSVQIRAGSVATPVTLKTFLGEVEIGAGVTVPQYLGRLAVESVSPVLAPHYAAQLVDLHGRRQAILIHQESIERLYDPPPTSTVGGLVDAAVESLRSIADANPASESEETIADTLDELIELAHDTIDGKAVPVVSTGLADLDRTLGGGLRPGRLIVLAGRPGMGKTILLTAIARRAAQKGAGIGVFSLEIDRKEFTARLTANAVAGGMAPMDYRDILTGSLSQGQVERVIAAREWMASLPLKLCERGGLSMQQIETRATKMAKQFVRQGRKLDVVLIDYLQLVQVTDRYKGHIVNEYGEIALAAKNLAKRLGVTVVLLSQLSRGVEGRENKRPLLSDLRGSGNIEEHADAVGLLYRPGYYDKHDPKVANGDPDACAVAKSRENLLELIWEKNRLGPTTTDLFFCDVAKSQVDSYSRHKLGGF